jgi:hypothetical protein
MPKPLTMPFHPAKPYKNGNCCIYLETWEIKLGGRERERQRGIVRKGGEREREREREKGGGARESHLIAKQD